MIDQFIEKYFFIQWRNGWDFTHYFYKDAAAFKVKSQKLYDIVAALLNIKGYYVTPLPANFFYYSQIV